MGALHEGHASLMRVARVQIGAGPVVVSVFANAPQVGAGAGLDRGGPKGCGIWWPEGRRLEGGCERAYDVDAHPGAETEADASPSPVLGSHAARTVR